MDNSAAVYLHFAGIAALAALIACLLAAWWSERRRLFYVCGSVIIGYYVAIYFSILFGLAVNISALAFRASFGALFVLIAVIALMDARRRF